VPTFDSDHDDFFNKISREAAFLVLELPMSAEVHFGTRQAVTYGKWLDFGAVASIAWRRT
jgi:hypothetical protein